MKKSDGNSLVADVDQNKSADNTIDLNIWELAWPAITNNLIMSLVGVINIKVVGTLGAEAVATVTTGHRLFFMMQAVIMAVTVATTALVARSWGANQRAEAAHYTNVSTLLALFITLPISLVGYFAAPQIAGMFGLSDEGTIEYLEYLSIFNIGFVLHFVISAALRGAGDTKTPLILTAITQIIDVILVYCLVNGTWIFPQMGVVGAIWGNGISFSMMSLVIFLLWTNNKFVIPFATEKSFTRERFSSLFKIGLPAGGEQILIQTGFTLYIWIVSFYGAAPYAAYGIGVNILSFSFIIGFGIAIAGSTVVGQYLGANNVEMAKKSGWQAMRSSLYAMITFAAVIVLFARPIASFMIDDPEVVDLTVTFIYILGAMQPLMAIDFSISGALRGAGDTRFPLYSTFAGMIVARLVLASYFIYAEYPVEWIYGALMADYMIKSVMLVYRFRSEKWTTIQTSTPA